MPTASATSSTGLYRRFQTQRPFWATAIGNTKTVDAATDLKPRDYCVMATSGGLSNIFRRPISTSDSVSLRRVVVSSKYDRKEDS